MVFQYEGVVRMRYIGNPCIITLRSNSEIGVSLPEAGVLERMSERTVEGGG